MGGERPLVRSKPLAHSLRAWRGRRRSKGQRLLRLRRLRRRLWLLRRLRRLRLRRRLRSVQSVGSTRGRRGGDAADGGGGGVLRVGGVCAGRRRMRWRRCLGAAHGSAVEQAARSIRWGRTAEESGGRAGGRGASGSEGRGASGSGGRGATRGGATRAGRTAEGTCRWCGGEDGRRELGGPIEGGAGPAVATEGDHVCPRGGHHSGCGRRGGGGLGGAKRDELVFGARRAGRAQPSGTPHCVRIGAARRWRGRW